MTNFYLQRDLEKTIKDLLLDYKILAIVGPRQSGKTTLVKHLFQSYNYYNFEDIETLEKIHVDPKSILNKDNIPFILDEVQKVPELFPQIQVLADEIGNKGQIILTGSSNILMQKNISQSFAGRVALLHLFPLSYKELKSNNIKFKTFNQMLFLGFYPEIFSTYHLGELASNLDLRDDPIDLLKYNARITRFYKNYVATYLNKDISLLFNIKDIVSFFKLLKLLAYRTGQLVKLSDLSDSLDKSHTTIKQWIDSLTMTFTTFYLMPYFNNFGKRLIKTPKIFFFDTGILCYLANIQSADMLNLHPLYGQVFENFIIADYYKTALSYDLEPNAYYWRNSSGIEIDLLIERGRVLHALEIKSTQTFNNKLLKNLKFFKDLRPDTKTYLIYKGEEKFNVNGHVVYPVKDIDNLWNEILFGN